MSTAQELTRAPVFLRATPSADLRFDEILDEWANAQPSRYAADQEIGWMLTIAAKIVSSVRVLEPLYAHLDRARGSRFEPHDIAMGFVDSVDLHKDAAHVLRAMVERKIPAPRRGA